MDSGFYDYREDTTAVDLLSASHERLALKHAGDEAQRRVNLTRGVRELLFRMDIELYAQGLEAWSGSNTAGKEARFPSEKR